MNNFIEIPASKISLTRRKLVFGVGINDAYYMVSPRINGKKGCCPFYRSWHSMLKRCYYPKYQQKSPTYIGCSVIKEWLLFSVFKDWMIKQDWKGKHLDKDIKNIGNRVYSPDTCLFVSSKVNNLLCDNAARRNQCPIGVSFHKPANKFQAHCRHNGKSINLGYHDTQESAHGAYIKYKYKVILEAAALPENLYIQQYLINHADNLNNLRKDCSRD